MRFLVFSGVLLLASTAAFAQQIAPRPVVVVRPAPVVVRPAPVVEYVMPRPVETPILSVGSRCLRVLGFPLVCGG